MIKPYKLRIDTQDLDVLEKIQNKYFESYLRGMESVEQYDDKEDTNPHVHYYIHMFEEKTNPLRQYIRKYIGKGNGIYSLKELDEEYPVEYLAYVLKDGEIKSENISQEVLDKAKEYDISVKASIKDKKAKSIPIWQRIIDEYEYESKSQAPTKEQVLYDVIKWHKDNFKLIREFQIVSYVQTILVNIDKDYEHRFRNRLLEKYF